MIRTNEWNQAIGATLDNWRPAKLPSPTTTLHGKYGFLEPLNPEKHGRKLFEALNPDTSSWTYMAYGPFSNYEEFHTHLRKLITEPDTIFYAVISANTGLPAGIIAYIRIQQVFGVLEIAHVHFSRALQKTPAATEALYLLIRYAFAELGYRRCEAKCDALNQPSRTAMARLGFKFEGISRQHMVYKQRNRDTAWSAIIDKEWPEIKARLEQWLHPDNFSNGRQKFRLKR